MEQITREEAGLVAAVCQRYRRTASFLESLGITTPPAELAAIAGVEAKALRIAATPVEEPAKESK